jgi:CHAT domain-containing protein
MAAAEKRLASVQMRLLDVESPTERQELSEKLIEIERQLSPPRGEPIRVWSTSPMPLGQLQKELRPDEAVLEYVLSKPASYCLWATHEGNGITQLADRGTIGSLVDRYLAALSSQRPAKDEARALFSALLDPIPVYRQKSHLIVVPDGVLHRIPFAGLLDKTDAYVIESHSTSFVHSGTVLTLLRRQPFAPPGPLLAVGSVPYRARGALSALVAKPAGLFFRGLSSLTRKGLVPLPSSTDEVRAISEILGGNKDVVLLGDQATETNFKKEAARSCRIMHLAVHGFADKAFPDRAGLVFAADPQANEDGLLQVREIRQLPLRNTSLVTLAACDTNVGRIEGEEGV